MYLSFSTDAVGAIVESVPYRIRMWLTVCAAGYYVSIFGWLSCTWMSLGTGTDDILFCLSRLTVLTET